MDLSAKSLREAANKGFARLRNFTKARKLFIKAYAGQYYNGTHGTYGDEPLNMAFMAVRALVPNIISDGPASVIETKYLAYREYAKVLSLGIEDVFKDVNIVNTLQKGLVDAIFTMGIFKVYLASTNTVAVFGEDMVDPGKLAIKTVSLDDFTFDPLATDLDEATFVGEKIRAERDVLLQSGLYDNDVVSKLPSSKIGTYGDEGARTLSGKIGATGDKNGLHDYVDILELWMPGSNTLVTLPAEDTGRPRFLRTTDYYGPVEGPYAYLRLTPPVPDCPIPVQLAGVWHDLHVIGNKMAKKTVDQAVAQKNILGIKRENAEDAHDIADSKNLDIITMDEPQLAQVFSLGGQAPQNEQMIDRLAAWFDQYSGNTQMLSGAGMNTNVATVAGILDRNTTTGVSYMINQVDGTVGQIARKIGWYLHTDPLIQMPLIQRDVIPAEYDINDEQVRLISPPQTIETQVMLTPEIRCGDFLDFAFSIKAESMAPLNYAKRLQQLEILIIKFIPAIAQASQICAQMGTPFSFRKTVLRVAKMMRIDWIDEIFEDPELIAVMARIAQEGPQMKKPQMQQDGGAVVAQGSPTTQKQQNQTAQAGANESQSDIKQGRS